MLKSNEVNGLQRGGALRTTGRYNIIAERSMPLPTIRPIVHGMLSGLDRSATDKNTRAPLGTRIRKTTLVGNHRLL